MSPNLLDRYLAGVASPAEVAAVEKQLHEQPAVRVAIETYREALDLAPDSEMPSVDHSLELVRARMVADAAKRRGKVSSGNGVLSTQILHTRSFGMSRMRSALRRSVVWGATLAFVVCVAGTLFVRSIAPPRPVRHVHTAPGQRSLVRLANGSTILLAPATAVTISDHECDVTGEAYFTIASNAHAAFVVRTANAMVRVLGTKFSVRRYPDESVSHIVVAEGKVAVRSRDERPRAAEAVLSAATAALVSDSGLTEQRGIVVSDYLAWTTGHLVFKNAPLRDVVQDLARAYGVEIRLADTTLARQSVMIEVAVHEEPLGLVLRALALPVHADVRRDGAAYVIVPGRSSDIVPRVKPFLQPERLYGR